MDPSVVGFVRFLPNDSATTGIFFEPSDSINDVLLKPIWPII